MRRHIEVPMYHKYEACNVTILQEESISSSPTLPNLAYKDNKINCPTRLETQVQHIVEIFQIYHENQIRNTRIQLGKIMWH